MDAYTDSEIIKFTEHEIFQTRTLDEEGRFLTNRHITELDKILEGLEDDSDAPEIMIF